jgi:hypothetical protein
MKPGSAHRLRSVASSAGPPLLYLAVALVLFWRPVWRDLNAVVVSEDQGDSSQFQWFLAWWPHAIEKGLDPFITKVILVPEGYNMAWTTSLPLPAALLAPVTVLFGPTVSFNVLVLLAAPLSAWAAFALCRHITHNVPASAFAGFLFGFSPYLLNQARGAINLALVPLVPLFLLLILKRMDGSLTARRFVVLMAAVIAAQYLVFNEVLLTLLLFSAFALALAWFIVPEQRAALLDVTKLVLLSGVFAAIVVSPFLLFLLEDHTRPEQANPGAYAVDLTGLLAPGEVVWTGGMQLSLFEHLGVGRWVAGTSSLGLPLIVLIGVFAWERRHQRAALLALAFLAVCVIFSFGPRLLIDRDPTIVMPWEAFVHIPFLEYALPTRFALFTWLAVAIIVALWLSTPTRFWLRWGLAALVLLALVPSFTSTVWQADATDPPFFADGTYKDYLRPDDNVLTIPAIGPNARWQARSDFDFKVVGGYLGAFPESYRRYPAWQMTLTRELRPGYQAQIKRYVADKDVTAIVVDKREAGPWRTLFAPLGVAPRDVDGVLYYRLPPRAR